VLEPYTKARVKQHWALDCCGLKRSEAKIWLPRGTPTAPALSGTRTGRCIRWHERWPAHPYVNHTHLCTRVLKGVKAILIKWIVERDRSKTLRQSGKRVAHPARAVACSLHGSKEQASVSGAVQCHACVPVCRKFWMLLKINAQNRDTAAILAKLPP
jgi:hypothetical protein